MKGRAASFASGLLFAIGLSVAGMTSPSKVLAFLDVAGAWDPALAFVMVGAIAVFSVAYHAGTRLSRPLLAESFAPPTQTRIDAPLLIGAAIFGAGWGLSGYCPGPALAAVATGAPAALAFTAAMLAALWITRALVARAS